MAQILLVEDEVNLLKITQMRLRKAGHEVCAESSGRSAIELIENEGKLGHGLHFDIVITDYCLGDVNGFDILQTVKKFDKSTQVLLVTAYAKTQVAVESMRAGAFNYLEKPIDYKELLPLLVRAKAQRDMARETCDDVDNAQMSSSALTNILGESSAMKDVSEMITRVAPTKANILITGESGTGKEVVARSIHLMSGIQGPFVAVNCGAIPETLVESELFGHAKGAFTGAIRDKEGFFQAARGGTLFLDEIGELPLAMQVKLLRAIQEKMVKPVGSTAEIPVSVRIIAATNRDLREEIEEHRFREDLFFRLNVFQISLPPLRERRDDIPRLIRSFLQKFNKELDKSITEVDDKVLDVLLSYDYRGNVRELENIIEHAATLETNNKLSFSSLPAYLRHEFSNRENTSTVAAPVNVEVENEKIQGIDELMDNVNVGSGVELENIVEELERKLIAQSLEKANNNKTEAAKLLGISFRSLRYRLKKYGYE